MNLIADVQTAVLSLELLPLQAKGRPASRNMCLVCPCHYLSTWFWSIYRCLCLFWAQPTGRRWQVTLQGTHNYTQAPSVLQSVAQSGEEDFSIMWQNWEVKVWITCRLRRSSARDAAVRSVSVSQRFGQWRTAGASPTHSHSNSHMHMLFMLCMWCVASGTWR